MNVTFPSFPTGVTPYSQPEQKPCFNRISINPEIRNIEFQWDQYRAQGAFASPLPILFRVLPKPNLVANVVTNPLTNAVTNPTANSVVNPVKFKVSAHNQVTGELIKSTTNTNINVEKLFSAIDELEGDEKRYTKPECDFNVVPDKIRNYSGMILDKIKNKKIEDDKHVYFCLQLHVTRNIINTITLPVEKPVTLEKAIKTAVEKYPKLPKDIAIDNFLVVDENKTLVENNDQLNRKIKENAKLYIGYNKNFNSVRK